MDLPALLVRLAPFGHCRSAILELWTPPEASLEETIAKEAAWAEASLDYLRKHFPDSRTPATPLAREASASSSRALP